MSEPFRQYFTGCEVGPRVQLRGTRQEGKGENAREAEGRDAKSVFSVPLHSGSMGVIALNR